MCKFMPLVAAVGCLCGIAHANLIVNGDFESGNTGFASDYSYAPGDITPAASYDVLADPHDAHSAATSYYDHTLGTDQGLMMAINGDTAQGVPWRQTVTVLPNQLYDFAAWTSSWFGGNWALRMRVNGAAVGDDLTTPGSTGVWEQHTRQWASGSATSATLEIVNLSTAFAGNDFALDDLSFTLVPEPTSLAVIALGGIALLRRRR